MKLLSWFIKCYGFYKEFPEDVEKILNTGGSIASVLESDEKERIAVLEQSNEALKSSLSEANQKLEKFKPKEKEDYYNNKYPKADITYKRRETDREYWIDVRNYFQIHDNSLPKIVAENDDEMALQCLRWVQSNIKYTPDKSLYKYEEYWAYPYQTLIRKQGDCEDLHILLANMMIANGIPYWKVRLCAGDIFDVDGNFMGGHCYLTYYYEIGDRWVTMDACFYPNQKDVKDRPDYKDEVIYGKGEVWFSWNMFYSFSKSTNSGIIGTKIALNTID